MAVVPEGTACMAAGQGGGGRGNSSLEAAIVAEVSLVIQKLSVWVYNTQGRWPRIAEYNMKDLNNKVRELDRHMARAGSTMREAWSNGRLPIPKADTWIWKGIELMDCAMDVQSRFNELVQNAPSLTICNTPLYLSKRCLLNFEVVVCLNRVTDHLVCGSEENNGSGSVEHVSRPPKDDHEFTSLSKSSPQDLGWAFPAVCQLLDKPSFTVAQEPAVTGRPVHAADSSGFAQQQEEVVATAGKVQLGVFTEVPAISSQRREKLAVMVRVKAPTYTKQTRAPLDLVMVVLDIGGRMRDELEQLKQGAKFIIHNLTQQDRLSIVTFGPRADRLSELTPMTEQEKRSSKEAVQALEASGGVKIRTGLKVAYKVLERRPRREARRLSGIIVLSDGKDKNLLKEGLQSVRRDKFAQVAGTKSFEESDTGIAGRRRFRTYTFGFGSYHDPRTLYYLASQGFGTYSFVNESLQNIRDAMALCIGGLTSIVAQDLEITIKAAHPGVEISSVDSGCHDVLLSSNKQKSIVRIKDLLGDEEKNLIVYVNAPEEHGQMTGSMASPKSKLLTVTAEYRSPLSQDSMSTIRADEAAAYVERPKKMQGLDGHLFPEVACEMYRLDVVNRVWGIWTAIPVTNPNTTYTIIRGAVKLWEIEGLDKDDVVNQLESLLATINPSVQPSPDHDMAALRRRLYTDLNQMSTGFSKNVMTGLPYMLSWLSSHRCQRAATQVFASDSCFLTVRMKNMIASVETALAYIIQ